MKKHLKIFTAFAFLALPNLCASAGTINEYDVEKADGESKSISEKGKREDQKIGQLPISVKSSIVSDKDTEEKLPDPEQKKDNSKYEGSLNCLNKDTKELLINLYHSSALPEYTIQVASSVTSGLILYGLYYSFNTSKP